MSSPDAATRAAALFRDLCARLGRDWLTRDDDVAFELEPRVAVHARGFRFFRSDEGEIVGAELAGGGVNFWVVPEPGETGWGFSAPLGDPGQN